MKSDYQEILVKITRNIISWKKIHCQSQKWELNFKDDENAKFDEQCIEKGENWSNSHHDSQNVKEKQHCSDDLEKIHCRHLTSAKSNMRACFWY